MAVGIRRGTTKTFALRISPLFKNPDGIVEEYDDLPELTESDEQVTYKVLHATDEYKKNSYFKWTGAEWIYLGSDTTFEDLGTIDVKIVQGSVEIEKTFEEVYESLLEVKLTQEETIRLIGGLPAKIQVRGIKGSEDSEIVTISKEYSIPVLKSLWNEVKHNE